MATLSFFKAGTLRQAETSTRPFPLSQTYTEVAADVFLVASVNSARDQCSLELLLGENSSDISVSADKPLVRTEEDEKALMSLRISFRVAKQFHVLEEEGVITAIELVRDSMKTECGKKRLLSSVYVHLFIGTSKGTVFVCNALRGTIMALVQFQYCGRFCNDSSKLPGFSMGSSKCQENEAIVRFAVQLTGLDVRLNNKVVQVTSTAPVEMLHAVYILHTGGQVVILGREALDVFISVGKECLDGNRPYLLLEWSPNSTISTFPVAGPAAHFISHVESVFVMTDIEQYSSSELLTLPSGSDLMKREIFDAAFFFGSKNDTTAILHNGPQAVESLLLCGNTPALSMYTFEATRAVFSARQTVKAVVSVLSGMARSVWRKSTTGTITAPSEHEAIIVQKPKQLNEKYQRVKNAFLEADIIFNAVQVDSTSEWAACYSESAGRIYVYDLMGGAVWRVMKGCRSSEFQWHVTTLAGKRMSLLVVHHLLRHVVEVYSLRLGRRVAACYVPKGSTLLRPDSALLTMCLLLLNPSGSVSRIHVDLNVCEEETFLLPSCLSLGTINTVTTSVTDNSMFSHVRAEDRGRSSDATRETRYRITPHDILTAALHLPLPTPITDNHLFETYCTQMRELETIVKTQFSPGVSDDRCLSLNTAEMLEKGVPREITAAQCLNCVELQLLCVSSYRRALQLRPEKVMQHFNAWSSSSSEAAAVAPGAEGFFLDGGHPHLLLENAMREAVSTLLSESDVKIVTLVDDVLPSLQLLVNVDSGKGDDKAFLEVQHNAEVVSPVSLDQFLKCFNYGGYKLKFSRDFVLRHELSGGASSDVVWSEIGAVFFGDGRGFDCLLPQLEIFGALGFQAADVAIVSLCWFCRSFACSLSVASLGRLADLVLFLKTCSDAAFLTGIEFVPCLTRETVVNPKRAEACILLLALCMLIRHHEKPISKSYHNRYVHVLKQLLVLRAMLNRCGSLIKRYASLSSAHNLGALRLGDLLPFGSGDTLSAYFFRLCPDTLGPLLCENIMGSDNLKREMGGVDIVLLLKLLFIRDGCDVWGMDTPWYKNGTWDHNVFHRVVVQPLTDVVAGVMTTPGTACEDSSYFTMSSQQLAGLCTLLVVGLVILEKELAPLREENLAFLRKNITPDANLFEGNDISSSDSASRHPIGSRSTRDYFISCSKLLTLIQRLGEQLIGQTDIIGCEKLIEAVTHLLLYDDTALFPLIPSMIRVPLNSFIDLICKDPMALLLRFREALSFINTAMFFAFTEVGCMRSLRSLLSSSPPSFAAEFLPISIPWYSMYEPCVNMLHLLPDKDFVSVKSEGNTLIYRMQARSTLLQRLVFMNRLALSLEECDEFAKKLSGALDLERIIPDMPQLVLLDASARHLSTSNELNRLLGRVTNRHLAARIAAEEFRVIVACCFTYYINLKKSVPKENRSELQRIALKLQSMNSVMSEGCLIWICSSDKGVSGTVETISKSEINMAEVPLEDLLVATPNWFIHGDRRLVEQGVRERLQPPRDATRFLDFNALILALARVAAEGRSVFSSAQHCIAAELPSVATRLGAII